MVLRGGVMAVFRKSAAGVLAAVGAGFLLGVVSRAFMRVVALAAGSVGEFSWSGSVGICVIFAVAMLPGAVLAAFIGGRLRWALPVTAALLLCIPAAGIASDEVGHTGGFSGAQWVGVAGAGACVFATIFLLPIVTVRLLDRLTARLSGTSGRSGT
jgi:hypothetical protein